MAGRKTLLGAERRALQRAQIVATIREIPRGMVSTYGAIARAAGLPGGARRVAATLRTAPGLPWHRVLGAGGEIKLRGSSAFEQRFRLEAEGIRFRGRRAEMSRYEYKFPSLPARRAKRSVTDGTRSPADGSP